MARQLLRTPGPRLAEVQLAPRYDALARIPEQLPGPALADPEADRFATVIDSQSIKAAETVGKDSRGYDAGKKINGRKRHLVVDTKGLPLFVMVTPADITDRNAAKEVLFRLWLMHPEITIVWADSAYAGQLVTWAKTFLNLTIKTVSRPKDASGFVVLPRRWVVERSHAWVMHARDYERLIQHSESLITWAAITLMTRRITRRSSRRNGQPASREAQRH